MIEAAVVPKLGVLYPYSEEDKSIISNLVGVQKAKLSGVQKPRSLQQLRMYWSLCRVVSSNTEDENWNTPQKVDTQCRIKAGHTCGFIWNEERNKSQIILKSISFNNMTHKEACEYTDMAFEIMAAFLNVSLYELTNAARMED